MRTIALLTLFFLLPVAAAAQETVELSDSQRSYNETGVAAIRDGDYALAISNFESSLAIGEANVTYLNLGRAYQRAGNCMAARQAYHKVGSAPPIPAPSREEINAIAEKYRGELPALCPATVEITCAQPDARLSVDAQEPKQCGTIQSSLQLSPGTHTITATLNDRIVKREISLKEGEVQSVVLEFPTEVAETPRRPLDHAAPVVVPAPAKKASPVRMVGLVVGSIGAAGVTTGLILDLTYVKDKVLGCNNERGDDPTCSVGAHDDAVNARTVGVAVYAVGGGLLVAGAILYLVGGTTDSGVSLQYNDGPGIAFSKRF